MTSAAHLDWFRRLDRVLWGIWAALPVMLWAAYNASIEAGLPSSGMSPDQIRCLSILPSVVNLSPAGNAIYWSFFVFDSSIYVVLLAILHRLVRRMARGDLLVPPMLADLGTMGVVLIVWPFLETAVRNIVELLWIRTGDLPSWTADYFVDVGPIAVGVFLMALRGVLAHAIALKAEHDLTV